MAVSFFRNENLVEKEKKGAFIISGGGDGNTLKAETTAKTILKHMNASRNYVGKVVSHNTNFVPS